MASVENYNHYHYRTSQASSHVILALYSTIVGRPNSIRHAVEESNCLCRTSRIFSSCGSGCGYCEPPVREFRPLTGSYSSWFSHRLGWLGWTGWFRHQSDEQRAAVISYKVETKISAVNWFICGKEPGNNLQRIAKFKMGVTRVKNLCRDTKILNIN